MTNKTQNPTLLNLDEVELPQSDITVRHQGVDHKMRVLTVDRFIAQQKRAKEHQKLVETKGEVEDADVEDIVVLIRDSVTEFFPTLPVSDLETTKLFTVFAWLNQMSQEVNREGAEAAEAVEGVDAEGNGSSLETTLP